MCWNLGHFLWLISVMQDILMFCLWKLLWKTYAILPHACLLGLTLFLKSLGKRKKKYVFFFFFFFYRWQLGYMTFQIFGNGWAWRNMRLYILGCMPVSLQSPLSLVVPVPRNVPGFLFGALRLCRASRTLHVSSLLSLDLSDPVSHLVFRQSV